MKTQKKFAFTIGIFVIAVVSVLFYLSIVLRHSHNPYKDLQKETAQITTRLNGLIHRSAYLGCLHWNDIGLYDDETHHVIKRGVQILNSNDTRLPKWARNIAQSNSSVVMLKTMSATRSALNSVGIKRNRHIALKTIIPLKGGERVVISDCLHAELNTILSVDAKERIVRLKYPLHYTYEHFPELGAYEEHALVISKPNVQKNGLLVASQSEEEQLSSNVIEMKVKTGTQPKETLIFDMILKASNGNLFTPFNTTLNIE